MWKAVKNYSTMDDTLTRCRCGLGVRMECKAPDMKRVQTHSDCDTVYRVKCACGQSSFEASAAACMSEWNVKMARLPKLRE